MFRACSYARLAGCVKRDGFLDSIEGTAADGTRYQMEFQVFWDADPDGDVRVFGDLCMEPQKPLLGILPVYVSDATDSFIMSPDGEIVA